MSNATARRRKHGRKSAPRNKDEIKNKGQRGDPEGDGAKKLTSITKIKGELQDLSEEVADLAAKMERLPEGAPTPAEWTALKSAVEGFKETAEKVDGDYADALEKLKTEKERIDELVTQRESAEFEGYKSMAMEIMETPEFKSLIDKSGAPVHHQGYQKRTQIKSFIGMELERRWGAKAPPVATTDVSGMIQPTYRAGVVSELEFGHDALLRIPKTTLVGTNQYVIPRETTASQGGYWTSNLTDAIDGDPTPKSTCKLDNVEALLEGTTLRFFNSTGGVIGETTIISIDDGTRVVTVTTDSLDFDADVGWQVTSTNYGVTAEGDQKPEQWLGVGTLDYNLKMLASILPTNVATLQTAVGFRQMIESRMPVRHNNNLSWHVIYGTDAAKSLQGFRTYSGAQSYLWSSGETGDHRVDAVFRAANLIPWGGGAIGVLMSQQDLPPLMLAKTDNGHYVNSELYGKIRLEMVGASWFLGPYELVFDRSVIPGDFTCVNWANASEFIDQGTANLLWGYENDDFSNNVIRARYEGTHAHAILRDSAFVVGEWDDAPT